MSSLDCCRRLPNISALAAVRPARPLDHLLHLATFFTRSNKCLGCCQAGKTYTIVASAERPGMQVCIRACAKTFYNMGASAQGGWESLAGAKAWNNS
jgi:hypothetical protein